MKSTFLQVDKKLMPPQNIQYLPYSFYVTLARILGIDEDVIQVNDDKNVKLLSQDLINITLEARRCIR